MPSGQAPSITMPRGRGLWAGRDRKSWPESSAEITAPENPRDLRATRAMGLAMLQKGPAHSTAVASFGKSARCQGALATKRSAPRDRRSSTSPANSLSSLGQMTGGSHHQVVLARPRGRLWARLRDTHTPKAPFSLVRSGCRQTLWEVGATRRAGR
jgi:hypothetical protein